MHDHPLSILGSAGYKVRLWTGGASIQQHGFKGDMSCWNAAALIAATEVRPCRRRGHLCRICSYTSNSSRSQPSLRCTVIRFGRAARLNKCSATGHADMTALRAEHENSSVHASKQPIIAVSATVHRLCCALGRAPAASWSCSRDGGEQRIDVRRNRRDQAPLPSRGGFVA